MSVHSSIVHVRMVISGGCSGPGGVLCLKEGAFLGLKEVCPQGSTPLSEVFCALKILFHSSPNFHLVFQFCNFGFHTYLLEVFKALH